MTSHTKGEALSKEAQALHQLGHALDELQAMDLKSLRARYSELFGELPRSKNLPFLRKQIAFRLQERSEGGLTPAARDRLEELLPPELPQPKEAPETLREGASPLPSRDPRLPEPGARLRRYHKGVLHEVEALQDGFRYRGRLYTSLSTIAKEITNTSWNGFAFFHLAAHREPSRG